VILDAKRKRVYGAAFQWKGGEYLPESAPAEVDPSAFLAGQASTCVVLGEGAILHADAVNASGLTVLPKSLFAPRAEIVYRLGIARAAAGALIDRRSLTPHYVRPPEAEERWARRHAP
jgi:tRNA A37 threonylcarbamoyladenosine modification protein TsaB